MKNGKRTAAGAMHDEDEVTETGEEKYSEGAKTHGDCAEGW